MKKDLLLPEIQSETCSFFQRAESIRFLRNTSFSYLLLVCKLSRKCVFSSKTSTVSLQIISSRFRLYLRKLSVFFHKFGSYVKLCCSSSKHAYSHYSPFARKSVVSSRLRAEVSRQAICVFVSEILSSGVLELRIGSENAECQNAKCQLKCRFTDLRCPG